jgi:sugar phosphate isomerase/epimerase
MRVGVLVELALDIEARAESVRRLGIGSCQLCNWNLDLLSPELAKRTVDALGAQDITISSYWAGWSGPKVWNFTDGPATLGLLPPAYRAQRVADLKAGGAFAALLGVGQVITHAGFIPENPKDPLYEGMIAALREVADDYASRGQTLLFETGQETPVTLLRAFGDIGRENVGVNLDPANLLLYGKANPVDAVDLLGPYIKDVHAKDGEYPTEGKSLGEEKPLGTGRVGFPALIQKLKTVGYDGALTIEREISGDQQIADILSAKALLEALL